MNIVSKLQVPSSNGLEVMMVEDISTKDELLNELINQCSDASVCRTASATPGLLISPGQWAKPSAEAR